MSTATATRTAEAKSSEGVKETLESIVIALILAFVFRAFIIEAFVIPTGSMAPTLYGAHGTIMCEDCGVEFAYGLKDLAEKRRIQEVSSTTRAICPNCNHANTNLEINDDRRNAEKGDRILVLKWPFDIGSAMLEPARWDVIVFKDPADGTTNFIKRLAGLPNEVLSIIDGDIYTVPTEKLSTGTAEELDRLRHEKYTFRAQPRRGRLPAMSRAVLEELDEKMTIARKTPAAQRSVWFGVYDHDHPPQTLDPRQPRWEPLLGTKSGWDASTRRVRFEDRGLDGDAIGLSGKEIRANCAYNVHRRGLPPPVADVRIRFVLTPKQSGGTLGVRLEKLGRAFWATIHMDGKVSLAESSEAPSATTAVMASGQLSPFRPGHSVEINFTNVDYRLALSVGGREVLASSDDPDSAAYYGPNLAKLRQVERSNASRRKVPQPPRIYGEGGAFELTHLGVERDIYYYHPDPSVRAHGLAWAPPSGWGGPESPILLRQGEYFMLGDNTAASKDSRLWDVPGPHVKIRGEDFQLGTVPRDQLIGKAFFVYWPSGHRLSWLPLPGLNRVRVIPDVGRMRWIR